MTADAAGNRQDPPAERPGAAGAEPETALNPLQRLIQQRLRERRWSYGEVAKRGGLARSTLYTLATTRNLARPPRPADQERELLVASIDELTPEDRRHVAALVESLRNRAAQEPGEG